MFSILTIPEEFKNAAITGHFGFVFEDNSVREITRNYRDAIVLEKLRFQIVFRPHENDLKRKASVFKFLLFEERFRKALFSWRISVDGKPNLRNKAASESFI